jgi:hypothetical protein
MFKKLYAFIFVLKVAEKSPWISAYGIENSLLVPPHPKNAVTRLDLNKTKIK